MSNKVPYTGMTGGAWFPPAPQLVKDAWMIIIGYRADQSALGAVLPPGLEPHDNALVQMNMYEVPEPAQTSGFGAFSLTYLTVEVAGHDSLAAEGTLAIPGRCFVHYWNSSDRVRTYAREAAGIPALSGSCSWERGTDGKLVSTLTVDGTAAIRVTASVSDQLLTTLGGHLNYYAHRQFPAPTGGTAAVSELIEFPLPFVAEVYDASVDAVEFNFPENHPASRLAPLQPLDAASVLYGKVTFTYSMGRRLINYLNAE